MAFFGFGRKRAAKAFTARRGDSKARALVDALMAELSPGAHGGWPSAETVRATAAWEAIGSAPEAVRVSVAVEAFTRAGQEPTRSWSVSAALVVVGQEVLRKALKVTAEDRVALLLALLSYARQRGFTGEPRLDVSWDHTRSVLRALERGGEVDRLPAEESLLHRVRAALVQGDTAEAKRTIPRVDALLGIAPTEGQALQHSGLVC